MAQELAIRAARVHVLRTPALSGEAPAESGDASEEADQPEAEAQPEPEPEPAGESRDEGDGERIKASPLAKRIAKDQGIDLKAVEGSGPNGRIVKADLSQTETETAPEATPAPAAERSKKSTEAKKGDVEIIELNRLQQTISRRSFWSASPIVGTRSESAVATAKPTLIREKSSTWPFR